MHGECIAYCWMYFKMNRCMICKWFAVGHYFVSLFGALMLISKEYNHSMVLHCAIAIMPSILKRGSLNIPFIYCSNRMLRRLCAFLFQTNRAKPHNWMFFQEYKVCHCTAATFRLTFTLFDLYSLNSVKLTVSISDEKLIKMNEEKSKWINVGFFCT